MFWKHSYSFNPKRLLVESSVQLDSFCVLGTYFLWCLHNDLTRLFPEPNETLWEPSRTECVLETFLQHPPNVLHKHCIIISTTGQFLCYENICHNQTNVLGTFTEPMYLVFLSCRSGILTGYMTDDVSKIIEICIHLIWNHSFSWSGHVVRKNPGPNNLSKYPIHPFQEKISEWVQG